MAAAARILFPTEASSGGITLDLSIVGTAVDDNFGYAMGYGGSCGRRHG